MTKRKQPAPRHLSPDAKKWWQSVCANYVLEDHHMRLLQAACETWDRYCQARETLAIDGLTVQTDTGGVKQHPCVAIERDSRLAFARLVRELDLDTEPAKSDRSAPPALSSNRR